WPLEGGECVISSLGSGAWLRRHGLKPLTTNSKYVKLNVGGSLHYTTLRTLTGQDTRLKAMFSGRAEVLTDREENLGSLPAATTRHVRRGLGPAAAEAPPLEVAKPSDLEPGSAATVSSH
uniref:Uncharacterized protein n=1 Tax=Bos mutus grunniens TaxID=30521 RepID=A0A8C0A450_BOSMU